MKFLCIGLFVLSTFLNWSKVDGNVTKLIEDVTNTSETTQSVTSSSAKLAKKTRKELDNMHPEVYKKRSNVDFQARRSDRTNNLDRDNDKASMTDEHGEGENTRKSFGDYNRRNARHRNSADIGLLPSDLNDYDYFTELDDEANELGRNTDNKYNQNPSNSELYDSILQDITLPINADSGRSAVNGLGLDSGFEPSEYIVEQGLNNESPGKSSGGLYGNTRVNGFLESMINELEAEDNENLRNAENLGQHNYRIRDEELGSLEETRPFFKSIIHTKSSPKNMYASSKIKPSQADKLIALLAGKRNPHKENQGLSSLARHPLFSGFVHNNSLKKHPMVANIDIQIVEKHYPHQHLSYPSEAFNTFSSDVSREEGYARAPPINTLYNMGSKPDYLNEFLGRLPLGKGFTRPAKVEIPYLGIQNVEKAFGRPHPLEETFLRPSAGMGYNLDINQIKPYNIYGIGKSFGRSPHIGKGFLSSPFDNPLDDGFYDMRYNPINTFGRGSVSYSPDNLIYSSPYFNGLRKSNDSSLRNSEAFDIDLDDDLIDKK